MSTVLRTLLLLAVCGGLFPLRAAAQYREDTFKRDAFSQNYADSTQTQEERDSSKFFSVKEFFGGLSHRRSASTSTLFMGSTVFWGGFQIYNKQYWKLPILYGGMGAGIGLGIYNGNRFRHTGEAQYRTWSTLCYAGAGILWWGSLLDGVIQSPATRSPDPTKAMFLSMLVPGLGQVYNGEAWKVPIYLSLMAGGIYFCASNNENYQRWKRIHNMATSEDVAETDRPPYSASAALYNRNTHRRYRDYAILATVVFYLLQVIDANVFAYMQDFDVSNDISLRMAPSLLFDGSLSTPSPAVGMSLAMRF